MWDRAAAVAIAAAVVASGPQSFAHGGPASVEVVSYNAAAPQRMAVGTTYGLATTSDGGATWQLTCEAAIGISGTAHPRIAVTAAGELVAGLFTGTMISDVDGCGYTSVADLSGYVALDVQNVPGSVEGLIALTRQGASYQVWRSDDDGASWTLVGSDFGPKFQAFSVGASSDPDRFYVGGRSDTDGFATLMVTDDGGQTFNAIGVPDIGTAPADALFVETVDPDDPNRLIAAVYEPPSKVLLSEDGGTTWTEIFEGWTVLTGLAVAPAFDEVVTGSPAMGLWRVALPDGVPEQVSDVPVRCLTWTDDALLICADDAVTGYAVGRSTDVGSSIEPLLTLRCLEPPACDAQSQVEQACAGEWSVLVDQIGIEDCSSNTGGAGGGSTSGAGGADGGGTTSAGTGGGAGVRYTPVGGCDGCSAGSREGTSVAALFGLLAVGLIRRGRRGNPRRCRRGSAGRRCRPDPR